MTDHCHLFRLWVRAETTIGLLTSASYEPWCFTLEDMPRPKGQKVYAKTRIWADTYPLVKVTAGDIYDAHARRWKHPFVVGIEGIDDFTLVRIHCGNKAVDTKGCPLVGDGLLYGFGPGPKGQAPMLSASRSAYKRIFEMPGGLRYIVGSTSRPHIVIHDEGEWPAKRKREVPPPSVVRRINRAEDALMRLQGMTPPGKPERIDRPVAEIRCITTAMRALRLARGDDPNFTPGASHPTKPRSKLG